MAAEYSYIPTQLVEENGNIVFLDGNRSCTKGLISHRAGSGVFRLKGASSVALQEDGETTGNATAVVTPTVAEAFFNVSFSTFIVIPCGCCVTVSIENTSDGTAIDVANANIIFDRVA